MTVRLRLARVLLHHVQCHAALVCIDERLNPLGCLLLALHQAHALQLPGIRCGEIPHPCKQPPLCQGMPFQYLHSFFTWATWQLPIVKMQHFVAWQGSVCPSQDAVRVCHSNHRFESQIVADASKHGISNSTAGIGL